MNLSIFVIVPLLMLLGLWLARNDKQVRGVMVAGASVLRSEEHTSELQSPC